MSFIECVKVAISCKISMYSLFGGRVMQMCQVYLYCKKQLSFKSFVKRLTKLNMESVGRLEKRHAEAFNMYVKGEIFWGGNIN